MNEKHEWTTRIPSTLEALEAFCAEFRQWRAFACAELDAFTAELLLREAMTNSVIHGAGENSATSICCRLRASQGRLTIAIHDPGPGFDWRALWDRRASAADTNGRGIEILQHYADHVRFGSNGASLVLGKRYSTGKTK